MWVSGVDIAMLFFGGFVIGVCAMAGFALWLVEGARNKVKVKAL